MRRVKRQPTSPKPSRGAVDAVVVGAGPNGLVAANVLADAGWDVLVVEATGQPGGAVASAEDVHPGFVHDTFSSFYPLSGASPVLAGLNLHDYGLSWSHAPAVVGTPTPDGRWALLHHDPEATAASLDALSPGDGEGWLTLLRQWQALGPALIESLLAPFPPMKGLAKFARALPAVDGLDSVRTLLRSARSLTEQQLTAEAAKLLIVGNAAHADLSPDAAGSGLFGLLLAMLGQTVGYPVPVGGAGRLAAALTGRLDAVGGRLRVNSPATKVLVEHGRAVGVEVAGAERIYARRAVIADVPAPNLYGGLVGWDDLPRSTRGGMRGFEWDPATVKVDWALSGPVPWAATPEKTPGTVHLASSVSDVSIWMAQLAGGLIPEQLFLLIGQMTAADPTRSPAGTEALWAYTKVPHDIRGDAGSAVNGAITGDWDGADAERIADRVQQTIERWAPGFSSRVLARRVLTPVDLERRNPSLVGGALGGGTSALHQQLVFRPKPGLGRAETPVRGLYLGSSSAHPGGGVHGACGSNAARAALWHARFQRAAR